MESLRWNIITPSQYEWERRGLDFIRAGLPDHDPYRAWANFEFQTNDGAIYEVDLLVLTKQGFFLVEIKSWPGQVEGDAGTWTRTTPDGKTISIDNPVLLTNRKSKALVSLLKSQQAVKKVRAPWMDAVVFLSSDDLHCDLTGPARNRVLLKDRSAEESHPKRNGILAALLNREGPGIDSNLRSTIDSKVAKAVSRAMEQAGIRPSQKSRQVGDYVLGDLIADGPGYQDRLAKHVAFEDEEVFCRVRQYTVAQASSEENRKKRQRAAAREFQIIQTLNHPGILPVLDYKQHELGPALLFRYTDPEAERFDHYLARKCHQLSTDERLGLLRQVADAIRYAHRKRVVHRALGPQSIIVTEANTKSPVLQIYNWQVGVQQTTNTATVTNVDDLVEAQSLVYMSPEALADPKKISEASDIFSLGAIAFHLFTSRPPAGSVNELQRMLREQNGLSVSAVLDGAGPKLEEFIQWSTHPDALTRIGNVEEFLALLDDVEDELTAPDHSEIVDPLKAKRGDRLEHGFVVGRVLGQGATARALLVTNEGKPEKQCVLKVALTDGDNLRLMEEGKALNKIRSEFVIDIYDTIEIAGRTVLVLQQAGEESLAMNLRKYGVPTLDLLGRYGENLLSAVATLEHHGVVHRDIKPDNIGIHSLNKQQNQLILYDFSLTSAPLDNLRIGTPGYTDPFLPNRKSGKWDLAAERYSAGVTLYEMTLGENQLPQWGEGDVANPDATKDELVIDEEKFKPSVREGLVSFFRKSLHRDPDKRFDNAEEMRFAWQKVFSEADNQTITTPSGKEVTTSIPPDQAELDTLIAALDLSARARDALDGLNLTTVKDLLKHPTNDIHMMRGVGDQYRREIIGFIAELRQKFPDVTGKKTSVTEDDTTPGLERLHSRVLGTRSAKKESDWNVRCGLLNFLAKDEAPTDEWPSQFDVADALNESRAKVGQVLAADQKRWAKDSLQITFRNDLFEQIGRLGGVVTVAELIDLTIMLRPATDTPGTTTQQRLASAISRAAVETEGSLPEPRFEIRRLGDKTLVSCTHELATFSETLGQVADRIAKADPLLPRLRVFQELYDTPQPPPVPSCQPFSNERLIKLATAMSGEAAVSSRQEIYPRNMEALRALRLGIGALSGLGLGERNEGFTIQQVHNRVSSRYPEAMTLPTDPKELELMLQKVGIDVRWDSDKDVYRRRDAKILATSGSSIGSRRSTATSTRHVDSSSPETVEARQTEDRLQHAYRDGGFLVLTVKPRYLRPCQRNLLHRFPDLERVSFDDLLFEQLRAKSDEYEFPWSDLYESDADGPPNQNHGTEDWHYLLHLMSEVGPNIETDLMNRERPVLLVHPGLIARYQMMSVLQTLRDRVGHDAACPGVWVLVATDSQSDMPYLDGVQIPLISKGQRAAVSEFWIDNLHRGRVDIKTLLPELKRLVTELSEDLLVRSTATAEINAGLREAYTQIEKGGRTAQAFEVWRDDYLDQVAVAWILGCVFVRFMEDNHLIDECWLAGDGERRKLAEDTHELYFREHPHESDREYFVHVFREVGKIPACRDLFAEGKTPLWAVGPSGDAAMKLLAFWRDFIPETGELSRSFEVEDGDTRFLGDLYQNLSERARKKYALLQTPVFVEEFILDRTLDPAVDEFGLDVVRMIDPTCGSGHFLLGGFARLFDLWIKREDNEVVAAQKALDGVWGVDINSFAVAIARFRVIVAALRACGIKRLKGAPAWSIHIATGDSLLFGSRWTKEGEKKSEQHFPGTEEESWAPEIYACEDKAAVSEVLGQQYHVVVGNPPYITVKDKSLNQAYRDRYTTCHRKYSIAIPFTERFFDLCRAAPNAAAGRVGMITANSFMKREFGKKLIEDFFPKVDLTHVIDTSGAYIPGHGTPTVILFARNRKPQGDCVRAVLGINGEPNTPPDPSQGVVWQSLLRHIDLVNAQDDFSSSADVPRSTFSVHPWSIGGGGAAELKELIESASSSTLADVADSIGYSAIVGDDEAFVSDDASVWKRQGITKGTKGLAVGDCIRDWTVSSLPVALYPYDDAGSFFQIHDAECHFWLLRSVLKSGLFYRQTKEERGLDWRQYAVVVKDKLFRPEALLFAFVTTHNNFVFDRQGFISKRSAPGVKLPLGMGEGDHLGLLGLLNSSTACFWMKQVFHNKGDSTDQHCARTTGVPEFNTYEFTGTGLQSFPLTSERPTELARVIDELASEYVRTLPNAVIEDSIPTGEMLCSARQRAADCRGSMIALQEELDWQCYKWYRLHRDDLCYHGSDFPSLSPGERAFEIVMARQIAKGESNTKWFERHGFSKITEIPNHWPKGYFDLVARRIEVIESSKEIGLIESGIYKRRWAGESWNERQHTALKKWLLERLESGAYWPDPAQHESLLQSVAQLSDKASGDQEFLQVAAIYRDREDFDVAALVAELVKSESVPFLPVLRYKPSGFRKRDVWEKTWELQRIEDAGEKVEKIKVPPKYASSDFQNSDCWRLRGKLDVAQERWISFPHCETESDPSLVVGWAGCNHLQQATAIVAYYDARKREGWTAERLTLLLAGLDQLLPWIHQWHPEIDPEYNETAGTSFQTLLESEA